MVASIYIVTISNSFFYLRLFSKHDLKLACLTLTVRSPGPQPDVITRHVRWSAQLETLEAPDAHHGPRAARPRAHHQLARQLGRDDVSVVG